MARRRGRISIYTAKCRRGCGKTLATASRSIWGVPDHIKRKYELICSDCLTEEEKAEMFEIQIAAVRKTITK